MTKEVRAYIEKQIRNAAAKRMAALEKAAEAENAALEADADRIEKQVYQTSQYKALVIRVQNLAAKHGMKAEPYWRGRNLIDITVTLQPKSKASENLRAFRESVDDAVEEALVTIALNGKKAQLDEVLVEAIAKINQ